MGTHVIYYNFVSYITCYITKVCLNSTFWSLYKLEGWGHTVLSSYTIGSDPVLGSTRRMHLQHIPWYILSVTKNFAVLAVPATSAAMLRVVGSCLQWRLSKLALQERIANARNAIGILPFGQVCHVFGSLESRRRRTRSLPPRRHYNEFDMNVRVFFSKMVPTRNMEKRLYMIIW